MASQTYHLPYILTLTAIATFALRVHVCPAERRPHGAVQGKGLEVVSDAKDHQATGQLYRLCPIRGTLISPERVAIDPAMGLPTTDERRSIVFKTLGQSFAGIRRSREDILADSL